MQRFTAKEVTPGTDNKPTVIKTEDGSKLSGFQASLKTMKPGTIFECETEIKKGYVNIKGDPNIIQEGNGQQSAPKTNGYGQDSPEKRASIETQNAVTNVMTAYVNIKSSELADQQATMMDALEELWQRSLAWCDSRIPKIGHLVETTAFGDKERKQYDTGTGKEEVIGPPFKDAGDFWTKARKRWPNMKTQGEFVTILEVTNAKDITDFDWAWLELEKKCG